MQKYQSIISGTNGSVIRNVPVTVLKEDGSLAEIFMDRKGQVLAPNPLATDSRGVFYFYAKNGRYSLRTAADGVQITDADTVLLFDPDETVIDGPIADAVRRAEDAAERAETALGDSGLQSMVQDAQDAAANAVQAVIDANQAVASIDAALIEAGEAKEAAQAAAQTASNAASGAQAVKDSLLTYSGTLSATPEWSAVPAHEDLGLDAQTQAALNRVEKLKDDQQLLKQRADKSVLSYPDYATASAAAAGLPDGQKLLTEVDETRDGRVAEYVVQSGVLAFVRYLPNVVKAVAFNSVAAMASSSLIVGDKATVGTTEFEVVASAPRSGAYPVIAAGAGYAVPVKNHTARRYGATAAKGEVTGADWQSSASRSNQGIEFDNRAGTLLVSSLNSAAVPQTGKLIEYSYSASGIGAEVMRTGELPIGHSEYFAIVYDADGQRYIWAGDDFTKTIRKIKLIAGATVADTVQSVSVASIAGGVTVNVFGYDHEHIAVWLVDATGKDAVYICRISDMDAGIFAPVKSLDMPSVGRVWSLFPGQMLRSIGGVFAGLSGGRADTPTTASAGWYDENVGDVVAKIPMDWATADSEVEGLSFYWNASAAKFETHASIWYGTTGRIEFYSLTDATAAVSRRQYAHAFLKERYTSGGVNLIPAQSGTSGMRYSSQAPIAAPALHIGGDRRNVGPFDPNDFYISQHNHISEGRESAVIRFKGMEWRFDGPNDPVIGPGYRFLTANSSGTTKDALQVLSYGFKVGNSRLNNSASPKFVGDFQANEEVDGGIYVSTLTASKPSFIGSSVGMTYATTFSDMYFGNYNRGTKESTIWLHMNGSRLRPALDDSLNIGTSGQRIKDIHLANNPIVTSDMREKGAPVSIHDKVLDAWGDVQIIVFQWLRAIEQKGNAAARWHFGVIAQAVRDAFAAHGLDACKYGLLCYEKWEEEWREIPAVVKEHPAEYSQVAGADGEPLLLREAWFEVIEAERSELVHPAGDRWGVRADQCLFLEAAWQRREIARLKAALL